MRMSICLFLFWRVIIFQWIISETWTYFKNKLYRILYQRSWVSEIVLLNVFRRWRMILLIGILNTFSLPSFNSSVSLLECPPVCIDQALKWFLLAQKIREVAVDMIRIIASCLDSWRKGSSDDKAVNYLQVPEFACYCFFDVTFWVQDLFFFLLSPRCNSLASVAKHSFTFLFTCESSEAGLLRSTFSPVWYKPAWCLQMFILACLSGNRRRLLI